MAFRKHAALALALAFVTICFGCADDINAPNTTDQQPVPPPTNVKALALNSGHVRITWDASSQPTITGYNLYRREVGNGGPKRLNSTRLQDPAYFDEATVRLKQYEYRVTAVNNRGKESHFTSVVVFVHAADDRSGRVPVPVGD